MQNTSRYTLKGYAGCSSAGTRSNYNANRGSRTHTDSVILPHYAQSPYVCVYMQCGTSDKKLFTAASLCLSSCVIKDVQSNASDAEPLSLSSIFCVSRSVITSAGFSPNQLCFRPGSCSSNITDSVVFLSRRSPLSLPSAALLALSC